jgi:hypothetical protein
MSNLKLDRATLAKFLPNHQAIVAFERAFESINSTIPAAVDNANSDAATAMSLIQETLTALAAISELLEQLVTAPAAPPWIEANDTAPAAAPFVETNDTSPSPQPWIDVGDTAPRVNVGTIASQNADEVEITGGLIGLSAGTVAAPSFYLVDSGTGLYRVGANSWGMSIAGVNLVTYSSTSAAFTQNVSTTKQLISTIATGTAPLVVTSTTLVPNLHAAVADSLGTAAAYPANATDLATVITLANFIKSANIAKGV